MTKIYLFSLEEVYVFGDVSRGFPNFVCSTDDKYNTDTVLSGSTFHRNVQFISNNEKNDVDDDNDDDDDKSDRAIVVFEIEHYRFRYELMHPQNVSPEQYSIDV